ncbi:hypothetical protein HETIRDRAFT_421455 [Heterobasidion irregulare TC 32-1]|uniref:Uncharacterized protein n=1 Tax=Heterobasidion irregulare (strain TC 32-1) TaxID=747525 RepID=W4JUU1_HETIT|nr:uncharacterized protein HETIRDRAFT_421455 [Heterobasidion irregulare TC 32-1]ETW77313.1 hypothetical protein HETIRDRAFT_421455 [Heterobasidion irregulare TC 32-1]
MLLLPPPDAPDTRPRYHISVHMNYFIPTSYITVVRKGATENGQCVGEFEMGLSERRSTVTIGQYETFLSSVLSRTGSHLNGEYHWRNLDLHLYWDCRGRLFKVRAPTLLALNLVFSVLNSSPLQCFMINDVTKARAALAIYESPGLHDLRREGIDLVHCLEVTPDGQEHFDLILLSVLIIERKRLTPLGKDLGKRLDA